MTSRNGKPVLLAIDHELHIVRYDGAAADRCLGAPFLTIVHECDRARVLEFLREAQQQPRVYACDFVTIDLAEAWEHWTLRAAAHVAGSGLLVSAVRCRRSSLLSHPYPSDPRGVDDELLARAVVPLRRGSRVSAAKRSPRLAIDLQWAARAPSPAARRDSRSPARRGENTAARQDRTL